MYKDSIKMIIPIKCVTCGTVLADKYQYYLEEVKKLKEEQGLEPNSVLYYKKEMSNKPIEKTPEGVVLDRLKLHNVCCRRHMLTHIDNE
jgi:DNA-directed RNA polymerase I, II, and III subunit RPABC5